jgi:signal transduction histidine kinase
MLMAATPVTLDAIPLRRIPTDIRTLLGSSLAELQNQARAFDVSLVVVVEDEVPRAVPLDRAKIAWVLTALVGNALRYVRHGSHTMPGGSITVRVAPDSTASQIAVEVRDDGPGIPEDRLRSLFVDSGETVGTALALAMARDVVAAHGGTLEIQSQTEALSHGTTVRFTLQTGE